LGPSSLEKQAQKQPAGHGRPPAGDRRGQGGTKASETGANHWQIHAYGYTPAWKAGFCQPLDGLGETGYASGSRLSRLTCPLWAGVPDERMRRRRLCRFGSLPIIENLDVVIGILKECRRDVFRCILEAFSQGEEREKYR